MFVRRDFGNLSTLQSIGEHTPEKDLMNVMFVKKFVESSHLVVYKRTNTGGRPYECDVVADDDMEAD